MTQQAMFNTFDAFSLFSLFFSKKNIKRYLVFRMEKSEKVFLINYDIPNDQGCCPCIMVPW